MVSLIGRISVDRSVGFSSDSEHVLDKSWFARSLKIILSHRSSWQMTCFSVAAMRGC